jgi:hypothetical protein
MINGKNAASLPRNADAWHHALGAANTQAGKVSVGLGVLRPGVGCHLALFCGLALAFDLLDGIPHLAHTQALHPARTSQACQ